MKKIVLELARQAKKKGICKEWYSQLLGVTTLEDLFLMYLEGIDFCLSQNFPSNQFIKDNFSEEDINEFGIFLNQSKFLIDPKKAVFLGACSSSVQVSGYQTTELFVTDTTKLSVLTTGSAFVMIDAFDETIVNLSAVNASRVVVNLYGNAKLNILEQSTDCYIKEVKKYKKTY